MSNNRSSALSPISNKRMMLAVAVLLLILSALAVVSARGWSETKTPVTEPVISSAAPTMVAPTSVPVSPMTSLDDEKKWLEPLSIKLRRTGFEPSEITRTKGRFLLAFDNRTGADEIVLQLSRESGDKLHEVKMPRGTVRWRQALDLHPGTYVLSVTDHPEWVCRLTITAR